MDILLCRSISQGPPPTTKVKRVDCLLCKEPLWADVKLETPVDQFMCFPCMRKHSDKMLNAKFNDVSNEQIEELAMVMGCTKEETRQKTTAFIEKLKKSVSHHLN